jgi:hypothetical protein
MHASERKREAFGTACSFLRCHACAIGAFAINVFLGYTQVLQTALELPRLADLQPTQSQMSIGGTAVAGAHMWISSNVNIPGWQQCQYPSSATAHPSRHR